MRGFLLANPTAMGMLFLRRIIIPIFEDTLEGTGVGAERCCVALGHAVLPRSHALTPTYLILWSRKKIKKKRLTFAGVHDEPPTSFSLA